MDEYLSRVYLFALRLTKNRQEAEDLAQETFLKAWRHREQMRDPKAKIVWLFTIAKNLWNDRLRRQTHRPSAAEPLEDELPSAAGEPDQDLMIREELHQVFAAMESLPERQREVLYLFACEGFALWEIAEVLGITTDAAKASLFEARRRLRRQFRETGGDLLRNERNVP